ncbi:MAG: hypothetical protein N3F07_00910 [Candidatus Micrarchaeota archaeon]|nr:hypothetical protein [Candidatus Micrarchaeota archaeon]
MGCPKRHLAFLASLLLFGLAFPSGLSGCFSPSPLERFWESPGYFESNPHVSNLGIFKFYSYAFDNSTKSLELEQTALLSQQEIFSALSLEQREEFFPAIKELEASQSHLSKAKAHAAEAQRLSSESQKLASHIFDQTQIALLYLPYPFSNLPAIWLFLKSQAASEYISKYPATLQAAYSHSASAYDSAQKAAYLAASLADKKASALLFAGAGDAKYSGKAKSAYYRYQELLSSGRLCGKQRAESIRGYFSSSPSMPDFSQAGFGQHLRQIAGKGNNSSLFQLALLYSELSSAHAAMQEEYFEMRASALESQRQLELHISLLESERLDLIDSLSNEAGQKSLSAGTGFAGLSSGLKIAKDRLFSSQHLLSSSESIAKSKDYQGYLSDAIHKASQAKELSQSSLSSLSKIRQDAIFLADGKRKEAEQSILDAESYFSNGSQASSKMRAQSLLMLQDAKKKFSLASQAKRIGEQFVLYSEAKAMAEASRQALLTGSLASAKEQAFKEVQALSDAILKAEKDGLDVSFEKSKLAEYQQLLQLVDSAEAMLALSEASRSEHQGLILRLSGKYRHLSDGFPQLQMLVLEIRKKDPLFLPEFDSVSKYFKEGGLDAKEAAGKLKEIEASISELLSKAKSRIPQHLSQVLSENAEAIELREPFSIGKPSKYKASIHTQNTAEIGYSGTVVFFARTSSALSTQDFSGGSPIKDAYQKEGKTAIEISGVSPKQTLSFFFEKFEQPVQAVSLKPFCHSATQEEASAGAELRFVSEKPLESAFFALPAPESLASPSASYLGFPADYIRQAPGGMLEGRISQIQKGDGRLEISYKVMKPFDAKVVEESSKSLGAGRQAIRMSLVVENAALDCAQASVSFQLPYFGIENFSVASPSGSAILSKQVAQNSAGSEAKFAFSPLAKGSKAHFELHFEVQNKSEALSHAIRMLELSALHSNSTLQHLALEQARLLAEANKTDEALLLSQSAYRLQSQSSPLDIISYQESLEHAQALLSSAKSSQKAMRQSSSMHLELSKAIADLESSISSASFLAERGSYSKAASQLRESSGSFQSFIAQLASKSANDALEGYSKAKERQADQALLSSCSQAISQGSRLFSQGEILKSLERFAEAQSILSEISGIQEAQEKELALQAEEIGKKFQALKEEFESKLSSYSPQYSSLSQQSRRKLPITPSEAQARLAEAQRKISSASKYKDAKQRLQEASQSYMLLESADKSLSDAISQLRSSAESSLKVARIALAEAQAKSSSQDSSLLAQMEKEAEKAEEAYANGLYADSLSSSDRVISAANALLSSKKQDGIPKAELLAAISAIFIIAAAYFLLSKANRGSQKKEKKSIPKSD